MAGFKSISCPKCLQCPSGLWFGTCFFPFHIWDVILPIWRTPSFFKMVKTTNQPLFHRIRWWAKLQETPIFDGKKPWFPVKIFPNKPIHWTNPVIVSIPLWPLHMFHSRYLHGSNFKVVRPQKTNPPITPKPLSTPSSIGTSPWGEKHAPRLGQLGHAGPQKVPRFRRIGSPRTVERGRYQRSQEVFKFDTL